MLLTLVGFVVLGPLLATGMIKVLGALLPRLFGASGTLAQRNAVRNPRRTGATAAALMIGLALVTGFSVITSSMVSSTNAQIEESVGAAYLVQANQTGATAAMVREIGLLRAIGLSRRQLRRMIRLESVVIAVFGALLGTGLGLAWGVTAQQVLKSGGLQVLTVPVTTIAVVLVLSAVVGLLAALVPTFRAGRMNVLAAIATD